MVNTVKGLVEFCGRPATASRARGQLRPCIPGKCSTVKDERVTVFLYFASTSYTIIIV